MKRIPVFLFALLLLLPLSAGVFSSYDFTFYKTADKSMMKFSKQAVGLDYTGYGYIGSSSMKGVYLRLGVQTPYDSLLNTLLELKDEVKRKQALYASSQDSSEMDNSEALEKMNQVNASLTTIGSQLTGNSVSSTLSDFTSAENTSDALQSSLNDFSNSPLNEDTSSSLWSEGADQSGSSYLPDLAQTPSSDNSSTASSDFSINSQLPDDSSFGQSNPSTSLDDRFDSSTNIAQEDKKDSYVSTEVPSQTVGDSQLPVIDLSSGTSSNDTSNSGNGLDTGDTAGNTLDHEEIAADDGHVEEQKKTDDVSGEKESKDDTIFNIQGSDQTNSSSSSGETEAVIERIKTQWAFSFTLGPAYRSFMGEDATVYFGAGVSNKINLIHELIVNTEVTKTSFADTVGMDLDFGIRFDVQGTSVIRIGTHFTADVFGWDSTTIRDKKNDTIDSTLTLYGYAFVGDSIFASLDSVWYIRLAKTFRNRKKTIYTYVNRTSIVGNGYLKEIDL